jgi:hypothetical protein
VGLIAEAENVDTGGGEHRIMNFEFRISDFKIKQSATHDGVDLQGAAIGPTSPLKIFGSVN